MVSHNSGSGKLLDFPDCSASSTLAKAMCSEARQSAQQSSWAGIRELKEQSWPKLSFHRETPL